MVVPVCRVWARPASSFAAFRSSSSAYCFNRSWSAGWERLAASRRARWASARRLSASFFGIAHDLLHVGPTRSGRGIANNSQARKNACLQTLQTAGRRATWTPGWLRVMRLWPGASFATFGPIRAAKPGDGPCCIQSRAALSSGTMRKSTVPALPFVLRPEQAAAGLCRAARCLIR